MVKGTISVTSKGDPNILKKIMADLGNMDVYVGIPEEKASRQSEGEINNAELAYIHTHGVRAKSMRTEMQPNMDSGLPYSKAYEMYIQEHGSPLWHSPPRPIIEPAIEKHKDSIAEKLKPAMQAALSGDEQGAREGLEKAGKFASGKVKDYFTDPDNGWPDNSPYTVLEKIRKQSKSKGKAGKLARDIVRHVDEGGSLSDISGLQGMTNPMIDTGALRQAITYVVGEKND